jgi:hypothetical protein
VLITLSLLEEEVAAVLMAQAVAVLVDFALAQAYL